MRRPIDRVQLTAARNSEVAAGKLTAADKVTTADKPEAAERRAGAEPGVADMPEPADKPGTAAQAEAEPSAVEQGAPHSLGRALAAEPG